MNTSNFSRPLRLVFTENSGKLEKASGAFFCAGMGLRLATIKYFIFVGLGKCQSFSKTSDAFLFDLPGSMNNHNCLGYQTDHHERYTNGSGEQRRGRLIRQPRQCVLFEQRGEGQQEEKVEVTVVI